MKLMSEALAHRRLRAPAQSGGKLVAPPMDDVGQMIEQNAAITAASDYDVQGRPLGKLAEQARDELVQAAWAYTRSYLDVPSPTGGQATRLILAGHQPQLFHPGVWYKNFVLGAIAKRHDAVAVNLAIDSDTIKSAAVRVPSGTVATPIVQSIAFDQQSARIPYEARRVIDPECFGSFGRRVADAISELVPDPFVRAFWPLVEQRAEACGNLGQCIAQARHIQESRWGGTTLEIPQSHVCDLPAFHWFACHLLARLPQLWDVYNRSVSDFRRANHVRSSAHPVPDLSVDGDWLEAPFWIWDVDDPNRRRLFARSSGDAIELSDLESFTHRLPLTPDGDAARAADELAELSGRGVRIRTRALITTLFARVCLGDLFLHGIGGAKYDQVTDAIIERFFGIKPPQYMTVTATLRLPVAQAGATHDDARQVSAALRDLAFHPERSVQANGDTTLESLLEQKRRWVATPQTADNARQRCHQIRDANEGLQPFLADERKALLAQQAAIETGLRNQGILASRDYAFCLYPEASLRQLMQV